VSTAGLTRSRPVAEPDRLPGDVDLATLAALVAGLLAPQADPEVITQRCADAVVARLRPIVERIEAAAQRERRSLGPYVPPPGSLN
jgi:hypothetical protein